MERILRTKGEGVLSTAMNELIAELSRGPRRRSRISLRPRRGEVVGLFRDFLRVCFFWGPEFETAGVVGGRMVVFRIEQGIAAHIRAKNTTRHRGGLCLLMTNDDGHARGGCAGYNVTGMRGNKSSVIPSQHKRSMMPSSVAEATCTPADRSRIARRQGPPGGQRWGLQERG